MIFDDWISVTLGDLIPALNKNNPDSMLSKANQTLENSFSEINEKFNTMNNFVIGLNNIKNAAEQVKNSVQSVMDSISGTGFHQTTIRSAIGKSQFVNTVNNSLNHSTAPEINDSTCVGAVILLVTGATTNEVNNKISELQNVMTGINRQN